jgi:hypothetical protein
MMSFADGKIDFIWAIFSCSREKKGEDMRMENKRGKKRE